MTLNVYQGTNFSEAMGARSLPEFLAAVTLTINNVRATNPPARAAALAELIADEEPDLVSLQEVAQWRTGPNPYALKLEFDLLQLILDELTRRGQHYRTVAELTHFDITAPGIDGNYVRASQRIAVLARSDRDEDEFQFSNVQTGLFVARLVVPLPPPLPSVPTPRGFISVDVTFHGETFRFICSHLDSYVPIINLLQVRELLNGPANTSMPVIIAMDGNSPAAPQDQFSEGYNTLITAGFTDAWSAVRPNDTGFTCCQAQNLLNPESNLFQRIDVVLVRGQFRARQAELIVVEAEDRPQGLWPTDHAGVFAKLRLLPN